MVGKIVDFHARLLTGLIFLLVVAARNLTPSRTHDNLTLRLLLPSMRRIPVGRNVRFGSEAVIIGPAWNRLMC